MDFGLTTQETTVEMDAVPQERPILGDRLESFARNLEFEKTLTVDNFSRWRFDSDETNNLVGIRENGQRFIFSKRACKNLCKYSGVPTSLIRSLTPETLTRVFVEQMGHKSLDEYRYALGPDGEVVFAQPAELNYNGYNELLMNVQKFGDPIYVKGNPLSDEGIEFMFRSNSLDFDDQDKMLIGISLLFYPTQTHDTSITSLLYRLICSNGLIDPQSSTPRRFKKNDFNTVDITAAVDYYINTPVANVYTDHVRTFKGRPMTGHQLIDESPVISNFVLPAAVKKANKYVEAIVEPTEGTEGMRSALVTAGTPTIDTLWDGINVYSYVANEFPQLSSTKNIQTGVFNWAMNYLK